MVLPAGRNGEKLFEGDKAWDELRRTKLQCKNKKMCTNRGQVTFNSFVLEQRKKQKENQEWRSGRRHA